MVAPDCCPSTQQAGGRRTAESLYHPMVSMSKSYTLLEMEEFMNDSKSEWKHYSSYFIYSVSKKTYPLMATSLLSWYTLTDNIH